MLRGNMKTTLEGRELAFAIALALARAEGMSNADFRAAAEELRAKGYAGDFEGVDFFKEPTRPAVDPAAVLLAQEAFEAQIPRARAEGTEAAYRLAVDLAKLNPTTPAEVHHVDPYASEGKPLTEEQIEARKNLN